MREVVVVVVGVMVVGEGEENGEVGRGGKKRGEGGLEG